VITPGTDCVMQNIALTLGYPPFCSENAHDVYRKIIDWRNHLYFPDDVHLSREAEDLVRR
jgi:protein-serine/threonine kinase